MFATYFSIGTDPDFLELLDGNELYEGIGNRGMKSVVVGWGWVIEDALASQ